jgi:hypothetical protein
MEKSEPTPAFGDSWRSLLCKSCIVQRKHDQKHLRICQKSVSTNLPRFDPGQLNEEQIAINSEGHLTKNKSVHET